MLDLLLVFVLGHLITDFVLQTDKSCQGKASPVLKKRVFAILLHILIYCCVNFAILAIMGLISVPAAISVVVLTLAHGLVDLCKSCLKSKVKDLPLLLADQLLHMSAIGIVVWRLFPRELGAVTAAMISDMKLHKSVEHMLSDTHKVLLILSMLIVITVSANVLIRSILSSLNIRMTFRKDLPLEAQDDGVKTGRYIGGLERMLTVIALLAGSYEGIIALYAAKTAIRFKQASGNIDFEEYYILGTLISLFIGVISGITLKIIL